MPVIHFIPQNVTLSVPEGTRLLDAARQAGLTVEAPCDGMGGCGKCRVKVSARGAVREEPHRLLTEAERSDGWVLSCQSAVLGDLEVFLPPPPSEDLDILTDGQPISVPVAPWIRKCLAPEGTQPDSSPSRIPRSTQVFAGDRLLATEPGDTTSHLYGLAVDIGTTTLVAALTDLRDGRELAVASSLNPQARYAQDVLSRIQMASQAEGLRTLHKDLICELNRLIGELVARAGLSANHIYEAVFSGNTTMLHLALGASPASLGEYPFTPVLTGGLHEPAAQIDLAISPHGLIYLPPILSAFVGADITAGILATRLASLPGVSLFVDIGTNGEMVLAIDGRLTATSTAAGPAFEGMNISCGMRASRGAIEAVLLRDHAVQICTIGQAEPAGVCGSGLLDAVGELVACHAIDKQGRFQPDGFHGKAAGKELWEFMNGALVFRLAGPVYLSQKDIRQVQLAKGAIRAGIELMLRANHLSAAQVDRILVAGSFGCHLRPASLIHVGLLPRDFAGRIEFVGNTSKTGAQAMLLNHPARHDLKTLIQSIQPFDLASHPEFQETFVDSLYFAEE